MTSQEAIEIINLRWDIMDYGESEALGEALDVAIEALKQQKVGHQIPVIDTWGDEVTTVDGYKCSVCGNFDCLRTKYCHECGAKFEESEGGS